MCYFKTVEMVCFKGQATFNPIGKIFLYYGNVTKGSKEFVFETFNIVSKSSKIQQFLPQGRLVQRLAPL